MPWTDIIWTRRPSPSSDLSTPTSPPSSLASTPNDTTTSNDPSPLLSRASRALTTSSQTTGLPLQILLPTLLLTTLSLGTISLYRTRLRRIPTAPHIPLSFLRRRKIYGYCTSVGDGDNFRLYHTPGGIGAGWGWLPSRRAFLPTTRAATASAGGAKDGRQGSKTREAGGGGKAKLETIHVRLAGVDAPELPHFGRPGQPGGEEALAMLKGLVLGRYVTVQLWRKDQYERVVGTAWVRGGPGVVVGWLAGLPLGVRVLLAPVEGAGRLLGWGWRVVRGRRTVDVGLRMLEEGAAGVYEAKMGSEFGGREAAYRAAEEEAKREGRGMWGGKTSEQGRGWWDWFTGKKEVRIKVETPREFKTRMKDVDEGKTGKS